MFVNEKAVFKVDVTKWLIVDQKQHVNDSERCLQQKVVMCKYVTMDEPLHSRVKLAVS